jgi:chromosomal replication initiation ATPase DnaA
MDRQVLSTNIIHVTRVRRRRAQRRPAAEKFVLQLISTTREVPRESLLQATRGDVEVARARHLSMYLMHVVLQIPLTEIGKIFGRDRTTVGHACARMEDMRDDKRFDAAVTLLEAAIEEWRQAEGEQGKEKRRA